MRILFVSAFAETDKESGANRLRKLREGVAEHGVQVDWLGPKGGYITHGWQRKLRALWQIWREALTWTRTQEGKVLLSLPPPWLTFLGFGFALFFPKRLILDFRDPLLNQEINPRGWLYRKGLGAMQWFMVGRASQVIVCAERISDYLPCARKPKLAVLAGLDPEELKATNTSQQSRDPSRVVYGGTFYGSRSPLPLLEAIAQSAPGLHFDFYVSFNDGDLADATKKQLQALGLDSRLRLHSQLPRDRFLAELRRAGAGLVITHNSGSEYAIPGKIYDYITTGVVSWVVSGDVGLLEFLEQFQVPAIVSRGWNKEEIRAGLEQLQNALQNFPPKKSADSAALLAGTQARPLVETLRKERTISK